MSGILICGNSYPPGLPSSLELHPLFLRKAMGWRPLLLKKTAAPPPALTAKAIYSGLCETVIGQEAAKKRVASAAFRHLTASKLNKDRAPAERIQKANILIIGPTGTGKTHIARALSDILKVPFIACDATQYTESGYVGMNVEDMLVRLQREAGSAEKMQNGVIYIDEIDKIASRDSRASHNSVKDVSGLSVQQELLKMLDGDKIHYTRRNGVSEGDFEFRVGGILFVAGGAFQGLEEIVRARLSRKACIGFNGALEAAKAAESLKGDAWYRHIITEDLIEYGFIPEFIGRFASIVTLDPLAESDVLDILTKPKNSLLSQYQSLLQAAGAKAAFSEADLKAVAREAYELKTGARGLKAIMEARVAPLLFDAAPVPPADPQAPGGSKAA
jgi:ATP-dependent Clp protease ATP-binding subunit ClpX